jgi:hypothetical protein
MSGFVGPHRWALLAIAAAAVLVVGGGTAAYFTLRTSGTSVTVPGDQIGCV